MEQVQVELKGPTNFIQVRESGKTALPDIILQVLRETRTTLVTREVFSVGLCDSNIAYRKRKEVRWAKEGDCLMSGTTPTGRGFRITKRLEHVAESATVF